MIDFVFKRGADLALDFVYTKLPGGATDLTGCTATAAIRTNTKTLVAFTATIASDKKSLTVTNSSSTAAWAIGPAELDVLIIDAASKRCPTITINVLVVERVTA